MNNDVRSLRDEAEAARILLANIRDIIGDDDAAAHDAIEGETSLIEAIASAVDRIAELEAHENALGDMLRDLATRKERFEMKAAQIRAALCLAMVIADLKKLELPQATISRKATPPKVVIIDETAIPSRFWKPSDPKLDKRAILETLKEKVEVPGAELSNGGETIAIKRG